MKMTNRGWAGLALIVPAMLAACQGDVTAPEAVGLQGPSYTVTYDPNTSFACPATPGKTCIGFVGKGDVQIPYGINNKTMQDNANGFYFYTESTDNYTAVCTFTTGEGTRGERIHNISHTRQTAINSAINSDPRKTGQWTGFNLFSLGATTTTGGSVPVVGDPCPGNPGTDGVWSSVELTSSSGNHLFVNHPTVAGGPFALN